MLNKFSPLWIFGISILATMILWSTVNNLEIQKNQLDFFATSDEIHKTIEVKLNQYMTLLSGAHGFFIASQLVEPPEWSKFVNSQNIKERFPGVQGLGFIKQLDNEDDIASLIQFMRQYGLDYHIKPEGKRDEYYPVMYLEPLDSRNKRAIGYDIYSEPIRRQAVESVKETGEIVITGKITLIQETDKDIQLGFLMMQPVYKNEKSMQTEISKNNIVGLVYAPFRMNDLMNSTLDHELIKYIDLKIYDGKEEPQNLFFATDSISQNQNINTSPKIDTLTFGHKTWTLVFHNLKPINFLDTMLSTMILVTGSFVSVLLFFVFYFINKNNVLISENIKSERFTIIGKIGANIAHDLRNPLTTIKGSVALLEMKKNNMDESFEEKQYEKINSSIKKIEYLTKNILDFAKNQELKKEEFGFSEIIKESLNELDIPNQIKIKLPQHDFRIIADKIKLQSTISNLIKNSIDAIDKEGVIIMDLEEKNDNIIFTIKDTGEGLSNMEASKIFEPLFTTKTAGTGLGLSICKKIIEQHNGTIDIKINPTTFIISLPKK